MSVEKIKVSAPRSNPHICYIPKEYKEQIEIIKKQTGLSLYALLCKCSKSNLSTLENIKKFKKEVKKRGFKTIGEWAVALIHTLDSSNKDLCDYDLTSIDLYNKPKEK